MKTWNARRGRLRTLVLLLELFIQVCSLIGAAYREELRTLTLSKLDVAKVELFHEVTPRPT